MPNLNGTPAKIEGRALQQGAAFIYKSIQKNRHAYPNGILAVLYVPLCIRICTALRRFFEIETDSSCAKALIILISISLAIVPVLMCSFSNTTVTPSCRSSRRAAMQSWVLRAKRESDFTRMRSILPLRQSSIMRWNSVRLAVLVPVMPRSA